MERSRPIQPGETELQTYGHALGAVAGSVTQMVTPWLLPFSLFGLISAFRPLAPRARVALMLTVLLSASLFALLRLYVSGGYCTPRHAIAPALLLVGAAGFGIQRLLGMVSVPGRKLGLAEGRYMAGPAVWGFLLLAFAAASFPWLARPLNEGMVGYRQAATWLAQQDPANSKVADATGWSQFYSQQSGYSFATLNDAPADPSVRWVVVREAHLVGPWWYCKLMRELVGNREPVVAFPDSPRPKQSRVLVFDRLAPEVSQVGWQDRSTWRRN